MRRSGALKIFFLLRLSVNVPFNALNYISGATAIGLGVYCVTLLGMLPGTLLYCLVGVSASGLGEGIQDSGGWWGLVVLGIVIDVVIILVVSYYTKRELDGLTSNQPNDDVSMKSGDAPREII